MSRIDPLFTTAALAAGAFLAPFDAALAVERERDYALAIGLTSDEFDEVYALCERIGRDRAWHRETLAHELHERIRIRAGADVWQPRYWDVPHLWMLPALIPREVTE